MTDAQDAVEAVLDDLIRTDVERGVQVAAYLDGELIVDAWAGVADPATGRAVDGETLFTVFSATKGVTATVIHLLAERGTLDYDTPVATYWPGFAANGKAGVTVRHVLTHTAGIPQTPTDVAIGDWEGLCRATAALAPLWEPGTRTGYHNLNFGTILGEVARRVDGRPIARIVREDLCRPLGITSLYFGIPDEVEARVAVLESDVSVRNAPDPPPDSLPARVIVPPFREWAPTLNRPENRRAAIPALGGIMNARSLARHYASLIGDGVDGVRLLPAERVERATALQTVEADAVLGAPVPKGMGYFLGQPQSAMGERVGTFGHRGYGGAIGFADPEYRLAFALAKNRLVAGAPQEIAAVKVARMVRKMLGIPEA